MDTTKEEMGLDRMEKVAHQICLYAECLVRDPENGNNVVRILTTNVLTNFYQNDVEWKPYLKPGNRKNTTNRKNTNGRTVVGIYLKIKDVIYPFEYHETMGSSEARKIYHVLREMSLDYLDGRSSINILIHARKIAREMSISMVK